MQPFTKHTGLVAPLDRVNVDTDQMVPKQFLEISDARRVWARSFLRLALSAGREAESGVSC